MTRLGLLSLTLTVAVAQTVCAQNTQRSEVLEEEIRYAYHLRANRRPDLCEHMGQVFNGKFQRIWIREPLPLADEPSPYAPNGKFSFPKAAGVQHDIRKTFEMGLSKLPSSKEFDAIDWKETRLVIGGPPGVQISGRDTEQAALIAYVDFDNDGREDRVIKHGFTRGYGWIQRGESDEYVSVWRSDTSDVTPGSSLWSLLRDDSGRARAITENGQYLRPFRYRNRTYVAEYEMHFDESVKGLAGPREITQETMTILEFRDTGRPVEGPGMPRWAGTTLCKYELAQIQ